MKKIFFRRPLFFASFILIFIGLQGVCFKNEIKEAYLNGEDVYATVMDNDGCTGSRSSVIKFEYNCRLYSDRLYKDYCNSRIGSKVLVRYHKKNDTLLCKGQDFEGDVTVSYLLLFVGIVIAIIGWRKKQNVF